MIKIILRICVVAGLAYCHSKWVAHRDLKPANCLVSSSGVLKIADFGLAREYGSPSRLMSPQACTMWYRAPEMLFGSMDYGPAADIWSVGIRNDKQLFFRKNCSSEILISVLCNFDFKRFFFTAVTGKFFMTSGFQM